MNAEFGHLLTVGGGLWLIVSAYLVVFLAYHIIKVGMQRRLRPRRWLEMPLSMQIAVGIWVAKVGVLVILLAMSRVWIGGTVHFEESSVAVGFMAFGLFLGLAGFLCILRVSTRPMLGHWPWVSCLICCSFYLLWSALRLV